MGELNSEGSLPKTFASSVSEKLIGYRESLSNSQFEKAQNADGAFTDN